MQLTNVNYHEKKSKTVVLTPDIRSPDIKENLRKIIPKFIKSFQLVKY